MITLTAEVICDTCKQVVASGDTVPTNKDGGWAWSAVEEAMKKAKAHGAQIGISTVMCASCFVREHHATHTHK